MLIFYGVFKRDVETRPPFGELIWSAEHSGPALFNHLDDANTLATEMNVLHGSQCFYSVRKFVATPNGITSWEARAEPSECRSVGVSYSMNV